MSTIADVAKLAGVSPGTVSRVMNGATNVNPVTRSKVEQAIAKLGYQPNFQARSLRSKRTDTIALAIPELTNYFWTTVARGVQDASQSNGYHVLICNSYAKSRQNLRYLESIASRVDGLILSRRSEWAVLGGTEGQANHEKPIVFVGQSQAASWNVDNVYSDSISGAFALTEHLIKLGHKRIAIVTGRQTSASANDRVVGYCMALADAGIPLDQDLIRWGEYERKTAERLTHDLIQRQPKTTAIVGANNEIAIGIMQALERREIAVPERVAVVCFDDFYPDSRFATLMTVASQSPYDIGVNAAQLLLNRLTTDDYYRPQTVVLPARMIVRQSSGGKPTVIEPSMAYDNVQGQLIAPLPREKIIKLAAEVSPLVQVTLPANDTQPFQADRAQVALLKQALKHPPAALSSIPHFEYALNNEALYRYVLEREPEYEVVQQTRLICPDDQIEFAQRSGIAAIPCRFPFKPEANHSDSHWNDGDLFPFDFPNLTDQLDFFDRYVRAARNTNVAIAADFRSTFADSLVILEALARFYDPNTHMVLLIKIANSLLYYQSKVIQLICDRFASDLAFVILTDNLADENGMYVPELFKGMFSAHLQKLIRPAQEHGLATVLFTTGKIDTAMSVIRKIGFDALYIAQPELNNLKALRKAGQGQLNFMGGISADILINGNGHISEQVADTIALFKAGGYVAGMGVPFQVSGDIPANNYFSYLRALSATKS